MSQLNYTSIPAAGFAGMLVDGGMRDVVSAIAQPNKIVVTPTATNSVAYTLHAAYLDNVGTNFQNATFEEVTYTSDSTATVAEITAGLTAAANADLLFPFDAVDTGATVELTPRLGSPSGTLTSTGVGALAISSFISDIPYGVAVVMANGASDQCKVPQAVGEIGFDTLGIALSTQFLESAPATDTGAARYPAGSQVNILRVGRVYVTAESDVVAGGAVYVRYSASGSQQLGALRADTDSSSAALLAGAKFLDTVSAGGLTRVQLELV